MCSICLDETRDCDYTFDGCGHAFHSSCLVDWLRQGNLSCPNCRTDVTEPRVRSIETFLGLRERGSYLRRFARRGSAPFELKHLVHRLRAAEEKEREHRRSAATYKREHAEIFRRYHRMRGTWFSKRRRVYQLRSFLEVFDSPEVPLPGLWVND